MNKASTSGNTNGFSVFIRRYREAIFSLVMLLIFGLLFYFTKDIKLLVVNTTVDARFWPKVCCIGGGILSVILFIQSVAAAAVEKHNEASGKSTENEAVQPAHSDDKMRTLATYAMTLLYAALLNPLGFLLSTSLYLFGLFMLLSEKEGRKIWKLILIDVVFTALVFFVFRYAFQMMLPTGTIW